MENTIVSIIGVSKIYNSDGLAVRAINGVSLEFASDDFAVLAGPSGSGKTTLLNLIGALDKPTEGSVIVDGDDLKNLTKNELAEFRLRKVGFVFQAYNLINVLTALENVEYTMLLQRVEEGDRTKKATQILERVGLKDYLNKRPSQMSGGQQQRVAVARAIASGPKIVLADEPTANLDSKTGGELIDLFKELNQDYGVTFILASHDPMVIEKAPRLIKLKDGEVVEDVRR